MRWLGIGIGIGGILVMGVSCTEVPPPIELTPPPTDSSLIDTTYLMSGDTVAPARTVLLEEFTGVKCVTCPQATDRVHQLDSIYGPRLAVIAYHVHDILGAPFPGDPDLRTEEGKFLYEQFWTGGSLPVGVVDRVRFPDEDEVGSPQSARWGSYVQERMKVDAPVAMHIFVSTESEERFRVRLYTRFVQSVPERVYLSIALIEDDLVVKQKYPTYIDSAYHLRATFRAMLTPWNGELWYDQPEKNRVREKEFLLSMLPEWNPQHCKVVAFLHLFAANRYEVLQAVEVPLLP